MCVYCAWCEYICIMSCTWRSQDNIQESVLSATMWILGWNTQACQQGPLPTEHFINSDFSCFWYQPP